MLKTLTKSYILRFLIPVAMSGALIFALIFLVFIPRYANALMDKERQQLKELTNVAFSIVNQCHDASVKGEMSTAEAQRQAFTLLKEFRYGIGDQNYFWLVEITPEKGLAIIMHPVRPDLVGTKATALKDADERSFLANMEQEVKASGSCFNDYLWRRSDKSKTVSPKTAYFIYFKPWNWVIGSSVYLDEINVDIARLTRRLVGVSSLFLAVVLSLAALVVWQGKRAEEIRAEAEDKLKLSERRYRILFEKSTDAIAIIEGDRFVDCNDAAVKILRLPDKRRLLDTHPGDFSPELQPDGQTSFAKATAIMKAAFENGSQNFEWLHRRADGELFPAEVLLTAIPTDEEHSILHVVWRDITERKRVEQELTDHRVHLEELVTQRTAQLNQANEKLQGEVEEHQRLENDIKQILNASGDALCVIDRDETIIYSNQSYAELTGLDMADILGFKCHDVFPGDNCDKPHCCLKITLERKRKTELDVVKRRHDGASVACILTCAPYFDANGAIVGVVETLKDVTERTKTQQLEKLGALQRGRIEMSNNILHDIGNAITSVSTNVVRIMDDKSWTEIASLERLARLFEQENDKLLSLFGPQKGPSLLGFLKALGESLAKRRDAFNGYFEKISRSIAHINAILDIQRHYAKDSRQANGKIDMAKLLDDALVMQSGGFEKRDIQIVRDYDQDAPAVSGDQTRMIQVLLNVMRNSCEAFDDCPQQKGKTLELSVKAVEAGLEVTIKDNASGFSPELAERCFERGFTTRADGSGIGLHECREIINSHHGSIHISSEGEGKGATLAIVLPT